MTGFAELPLPPDEAVVVPEDPLPPELPLAEPEPLPEDEAELDLEPPPDDPFLEVPAFDLAFVVAPACEPPPLPEPPDAELPP